MNSIRKLFVLSLEIGCVLCGCGGDFHECVHTVSTITGIVVGILIILAIIAAVCFGIFGMFGYCCGCLKTTEAPRRIRPSTENGVSVTTSSYAQDRLNCPPPSYSDVYQSLGSTNQDRGSQQPPTYSSLGVVYPIPTTNSTTSVVQHNQLERTKQTL